MAVATPAVKAGALSVLVSLALLLSFGARLAVTLFALDRGYEMGDEGYFLLNLNQPEAALPPMEFYRVLATVTGGAQYGVVEARVLRVAAELVGSALLVAGVFVWARRRVFPPGAVSGVAFALLCAQGTLIHVASRSLGYNDVTNLVTYTATGLLFVLAALPSERHGWARALAVSLGVLTAIQLSVKFPAAAVLLVIFALVLALALRSTAVRERAWMAAGYGLAMAGTTWALVAASGGPAALRERLAVASRLPALTRYRPAELLERYLLIEQWTLADLGLFLATLAGTLFLLRSLAARRGTAEAPGSWDRSLAATLGVGALALGGFVWLSHPPFLHWSLEYLACLVIGLSLAGLALRALGATRPDGVPRDDAGTILLLLVLLGLPFVAIAGTNVGVTLRLPSHALPLFVLLAVLALDLRARVAAVRFHALLAVLVVVVTSGVFVHHHWLRPYGLRTALHEQGSEVAGLPGVRVDLASKRFLEEVAETMAAAGFRPGDPILAFDYMPGLVHYLGGTSPRWNLYMFDLPEYNCFNANAAAFAKPPFVILAQPMHPAQVACLEGMGFPEDFELVRTLAFPYEKVYEGFGARGFSHVYLVAPRARPPATK